ncbi:MAG: DNA mismatch repair protein MutS, partial [Planctomycetota bacterium]|nr:DNA mismatch repair protein MutS [Planctomycetota bacterium]
RAENGVPLADWLDVLAEIEALSSLAAHAGDHPEDPFPEIVTDGATVFEGTGLAHPLLPRTSAVPNDVHLARADETPQAYLISGSNMSGKSTLMRTVGVNTVLAFAGAPVQATMLRLSPLALAASIRIHDSLQEGASRFYAEIARLKQVVDLTEGDVPVLFLLDEILHGTNSQDRVLGASAVVRQLVERGSLGLVSTHDLALADMARGSEGRIRNVHFEDQVVEGAMAFDYTLREGIVERSNAIALMRMVGLDVDDAPPAT